MWSAWPLPDGLRALGPQQVVSFAAKGKPYDVTVSRIRGGETYIEIARKISVADATRARDALV